MLISSKVFVTELNISFVLLNQNQQCQTSNYHSHIHCLSIDISQTKAVEDGNLSIEENLAITQNFHVIRGCQIGKMLTILSTGRGTDFEKKKNSNLCCDTADFNSSPPYLSQDCMQSHVIDMCPFKVLHWLHKKIRKC